MSKKKQLEYPLNVIVDFVEYYGAGDKYEEERQQAIEEYSSDALLLVTFEYVLACNMNGQELRLIHLYHRDGLTMAQAAEAVGVSSSRVGQILHRAWRKLRKPNNIKIIREGITNYYGDIADKKCQQAFDKGYNEGYNAGYKAASEDKPNAAIEEIPKISIEDLDPSVRLYNVLKRGGINTLYDLAKKDPDELVNLRNLGKKSAQEVIWILKQYNIDTTGIEEAIKRAASANNHQ